MTRLLLGLLAALSLALVSGITTTNAAPPPGGPGIGGPVTRIDGTTLTVQVRNGTATIATTATTTFEVNGAGAGLSSIKVGMVIRAEGTKGADGVFTATKVVATTEQPSRPPRR